MSSWSFSGWVRLTCLALVVSAVAGAGVEAAPLGYTCAGGDACNGSTYALGITSKIETSPGHYTYELVFGVDTTTYDGSATDYLKAIQFKTVVSNFSNMTLIGAPSGVGMWDVFLKELNANGCGNGGSPGTCTQADITLNGGKGVTVAPGTQYLWTFRFDSTDGTPNPTGHIKYLYVNSAGNKVGDLGSFDTPLQLAPCVTDCTSGPPVNVPEPATLLMLATGLGLCARRLRRRLI